MNHDVNQVLKVTICVKILNRQLRNRRRVGCGIWKWFQSCGDTCLKFHMCQQSWIFSNRLLWLELCDLNCPDRTHLASDDLIRLRSISSGWHWCQTRADQTGLPAKRGTNKRQTWSAKKGTNKTANQSDQKGFLLRLCVRNESHSFVFFFRPIMPPQIIENLPTL